jgi:translation initiation factor IF-2
MARLLRDSKVIYEGKLGSLRRFKDDVKEVQSGFECGISIENFNDVKVGDAMEIFEFKEVAQSLD